MKKPTKEQIVETIILILAIGVGLLVFGTAFVIGREIVRAIV